MNVGVIGGGFSGLYYGNLDKDSIIYEEHPYVYFNEHCTGLVTKNVVEKLNPQILNEIYGAKIYIKDLNLKIEKKYPTAFVIDRKKLENDLYLKIKDNVILNNRIKEIKKNNKKFILKTENNEYVHDRIIISDGPNSTFRKMVYRYKFKSINAIQAEIDYDYVEKEYVSIFLDSKYSQGFFAWAVPRKYDMLVGLATYDKNVKNRLFKLINDKFENSKIIKIFGGLIPIGYPKLVEKDDIYLIGDAGYFNKATSGGGLYYGILSAEMAYLSIKENKDYNKLINMYKKELFYDYLIHKWYSKLDDRYKYKFIKKINKKDIIQYINKIGDIDRPFLLIKNLFFNPKILTYFIF